MMSHRVVSDNGLKSLPDGCSIAIRVPWYRSLPLSVFEVMDIAIDGRSLPLDGVTLSLEGQVVPIERLDTALGPVWDVLDDGYLHVPGVAIARGSAHDVAVTLACYPPYIKGYKRITRTEKRLTAR
jgi:hypothetical protein